MNTAYLENLKKINELIKNIQFAMLTTRTKDGSLHSRPMTTQDTEFDGDVWFFSERESEKVSDIRRDPLVNVAYVKGNTFVSLAGTAHIVEDAEKKRDLWHEPLRIWFENGPDDPNVVLIHVDASSAEYWDAPGGIGAAIGVVRVVLTGDKSAAGDTGTVDL